MNQPSPDSPKGLKFIENAYLYFGILCKLLKSFKAVNGNATITHFFFFFFC